MLFVNEFRIPAANKRGSLKRPKVVFHCLLTNFACVSGALQERVPARRGFGYRTAVTLTGRISRG